MVSDFTVGIRQVLPDLQLPSLDLASNLPCLVWLVLEPKKFKLGPDDMPLDESLKVSPENVVLMLGEGVKPASVQCTPTVSGGICPFECEMRGLGSSVATSWPSGERRRLEASISCNTFEPEFSRVEAGTRKAAPGNFGP